jgi:uncharacterized protein (UPF0276 family)
MMAKPLVGLSLMLEQDFLLATLPLFQAGEVECLEWSFDIGWGPEQPQNWADELIDQFSADGRLFGHGVTFSPLSGQWHQRQQEWLDRLVVECSGRTYRHISEHFGFMTAGDFHRSAPLPVPMTPDSIRVGQDRLRRLADVARVPIGLENLAFAFGPQDVRDQGPFLNELLRPIDGFLLLDLHNIYCQMCNFDAPVDKLLSSYPLDLVRELHVSGGSWSDSSIANTAPIRRDTHDGPVPAEVFDLVRWALDHCPHVEAVILERLGGTFAEHDDQRFRDDFHQLSEACT